MPQALSRAQREAAFLEAAARMYTQLESWYEQHPAASFGEIEAEARQCRRELMGETLALLINGRSTGYQLEPPVCAQCGQAMEFEGQRPRQIYGLEGDTRLSRAYYVCPQCEKQTLFPPSTVNCACGTTTGVRGRRAWPRGKVYRPNPLIKRLRRTARQSVARSRAIVCGASRKAGALKWNLNGRQKPNAPPRRPSAVKRH